MKTRCAFDEMRPVQSLVENPRNPNSHPRRQLELLGEILKFQGWRAPIVVSKRSGFIVKGHGRLQAAKLVGIEEAPVDLQDYESEAQEHADLVADNKLAELSEFDGGALKDIIEELDTGAFDLELLGFGEDELADLFSQFHVPEDGETEDDDLPEKVTPRTKPGDVWTLGSHRLACIDSTDRDQVANFVKNRKADLVFTDPPYGVNVKGGKGKRKTLIAGDLTQTAIPFSFEIAVDIASKPKARLYFCGGEGNLELYAKLFDRFLHQIPRHIIWVKPSFVLKQNGYHNQYEIIFYGFKEGGGGKATWYGGRKEEASDVWQIDRDNVHQYLHPTQKPVALPARAIANHSQKGQTVYEPFSGSGSTLIACEKLGRKCQAIDLDPNYCDVTLQRWEDFTGKKAKRAK
jgi:DNA modification methylase